MQFVTNNPNMPPRMFNGQPSDMPMFQTQQYSFNYFDSKKLVLFYTNASSASSDFGYKYNRITTPGTTITTYSGSGVLVPTITPISSGSFTTATYDSSGNFEFKLIEPLQIDKMSDVFIDNITFANASFNASASPESYGVTLQINELKQNVVSNNQLINNRELIVINSTNGPVGARPVYYESKNKKFNYIGVMQPGRYNSITGVLCNLNGSAITDFGDNNLCFSIELVISNQK